MHWYNCRLKKKISANLEIEESVNGIVKSIENVIFRTRGWMSVSGAAAHVELCCKKVGDGHPLRLWRATTDVEAPPQEVMQRFDESQ